MCFLVYCALSNGSIVKYIKSISICTCMLLSIENAIDTESGWGGGEELGLIYCACAKEKRMWFNLHYIHVTTIEMEDLQENKSVL